MFCFPRRLFHLSFLISFFSDLSRNILRGIALALGGSPYEFEGKIAGEPFWVMRLIGYPGAPFTNGKLENDVGW